ncbi:hypothetical protein ACFW50_11160, partial [Streptomyces rochei]
MSTTTPTDTAATDTAATDAAPTDTAPTDTDVPARGSLRALLPALAGHRAMAVRTCAAALLEQGSLVALLTLAAHTVGTAVIEGHAPSSAATTALVTLVVVRVLMTWREMDLSHDLAYRVLAALRVRVFDGLARSGGWRRAGGGGGGRETPRPIPKEGVGGFFFPPPLPTPR